MTNQIDTNITNSTISNSISNFTGIEELQGVRSFTDEQGNPWFVLADICKALNIINSKDAFSRLKSWQKGLADIDILSGVGITDSIGRVQRAQVINEAGLYQLVASSRKPKAEEFMKWLYGELLPKLRQKYVETMNGNGRQLIDVMTILPPWVVEENRRRAQQIEYLRQQNQNLQQQNRQLTQQVQGQQQYLNTQQDRVYDYRDMVKDSFNHIHNELNKLEYDLDHHRINYKSNLDYISDNIDEF